MEQKIDLDALEAALEKATPGAAAFCVTPPGAVWDTATALLALPALIAELRELRAENAAIKARAWQSIETAPKNGTGFLAWNESLRIVEASWWSDNMAGVTHWQPFPDGPAHALPALIAELRELRARTTPEVIGEKHRDGNWWLVWDPGMEQWMKCRFECEQWNKSGTMREPFFGDPTHALPLPPAPEACP